MEEVKPSPPKTITTNKLADSFGHTFATLIKFFQLFGFLMIVFDIWYRYQYGKPMYYMHTLRFAIFTYGACCPWLLGGNEDYAPLGYRGWNDRTFYHFFDLIYHGYFGWGYLNCFNHRLKVDGETYGFMYINILPIEILLFMLGKAFEWTSTDGFARKNKWVQFIWTLKGLYLEFFGFPYAGWATFFLKQHFTLIDFANQGRLVEGRNDIVYWFSMMLALWMIFEVTRSVWEIYVGNRDHFYGMPLTDPDVKDQTISEENVKRTLEHTKEMTSELPPDPDCNPDDCQYLACYIEYWFIYQHNHQSAYTKLSQYYFTIWVCRWVIFAIFAIMWFRLPRTLYISFLVMNLLMIWLTVHCKKSFRWFHYYWILAEEILVTAWHLASLISFIDYYGSQGMRQGAVDFLSHVQFWCYVVTICVEFVMMFVPVFVNRAYFERYKTKELEDKAKAAENGLISNRIEM